VQMKTRSTSVELDALLPRKPLLSVADLLPILPGGKTGAAPYRFAKGLPKSCVRRVGPRILIPRTRLIQWLSGELSET